MSERVEIGRYLVSDPEVYHGEVTFKGTRIPVKTILTFVRLGDPLPDLARHYELPVEAVQEAVALSGQALFTAVRKGSGPT
jgi:uncharacterized protein (DUF433 family)